MCVGALFARGHDLDSCSKRDRSQVCPPRGGEAGQAIELSSHVPPGEVLG